MKYIKYLLLFISGLLFLTAVFLEEQGKRNLANHQRTADRASVCLSELETTSGLFFEEFTQKLNVEGTPHANSLYDLLQKKPVDWFSIFVFKNDSLLWWSDNTIELAAKDIKPGFRFYQNGWYKFYVKKIGEFDVLGLLRIKNQFVFQNKFLSNEFHNCLEIPSSAVIVDSVANDLFAVNGVDNTPLFYLKFEPISITENSKPFIAVIFIVSYLAFLISIYRISRNIGTNKVIAGMLTVFVIVITRFLSVYYNFPAALYELQLFNPSYYASSFVLKSLGDLLITSIILAYMVSVFYRSAGLKLRSLVLNSSIRTSSFIGLIVIIFTLLYSVFINHLISGLIINSRISFNINNVFELDFYSLVGVIIIGLLLFSFFMVCDGAVRFLQKLNISFKHLAITFFIAHVLRIQHIACRLHC